MSNGDKFQLDNFNHATGQYECVEVRNDSFELSECARLLGLKTWRIWNRTKRAARDRMLPPVPRVGDKPNGERRWSRVHLPLKNEPKLYRSYTP